MYILFYVTLLSRSYEATIILFERFDDDFEILINFCKLPLQIIIRHSHPATNHQFRERMAAGQNLIIIEIILLWNILNLVGRNLKHPIYIYHTFHITILHTSYFHTVAYFKLHKHPQFNEYIYESNFETGHVHSLNLN